MGMEYTVKVSDEVLESMALAAIEAYCLGDGRALAEEKLETLGYVWGYKRIIDELTIIFVSKISISISAIREGSSVTPNPGAAILKDNFVTRWSPQLSLLGDFHTHPYENFEAVKQINGFEFSSDDFQCFEHDNFIWKDNSSPLMLVMTICRLKRVRESWGQQTRGNVCSFSVGEFRFWLNASVGYLENDQRKYTGNKYSSVFPRFKH